MIHVGSLEYVETVAGQTPSSCPIADCLRYHIVPSKIVATRLKKAHLKWLKTPGRDGQQHRDTPMRQFADPDDEFLEGWEALGLRR